MSHYYLAPWVWDTTGIRPHWRAPDGATAAIDHRPLAAQEAQGGTPAGNVGFFLFDTTQTLADSEYFGDDLQGTLTLARRTAWRNKLGIITALDNTVLIDVLAETLGQKGDFNGSIRAKPLKPNQAGNLELRIAGQVAYQRPFEGASDICWSRIQLIERDDYRSVRLRCLVLAVALENAIEGDLSAADRLIAAYAERNQVSWSEAQSTLAQTFRDKFKRYLGGLVRKYSRWGLARTEFIPADLTDEGELPPETTISDDFNRSDGEIGANWTEDGDIDIVTNAAQHVTAGTSGIASAYYNTQLSSDDHYSQFKTLTNPQTIGDAQSGSTARRATGAFTFYYATFLVARRELWKVVASTFTKLTGDGTDQALAADDVYKIECDGSTIKFFDNGVEALSTTDTAITGNLSCGIFTYKGTGTTPRVDDFEAADLAAAVAAFRATLLGVGM